MKILLKKDGYTYSFDTIKIASVHLADEYDLPLELVISILSSRCKHFKDYSIIYC